MKKQAIRCLKGRDEDMTEWFGGVGIFQRGKLLWEGSGENVRRTEILEKGIRLKDPLYCSAFSLTAKHLRVRVWVLDILFSYYTPFCADGSTFNACSLNPCPSPFYYFLPCTQPRSFLFCGRVDCWCSGFLSWWTLSFYYTGRLLVEFSLVSRFFCMNEHSL